MYHHELLVGMHSGRRGNGKMYEITIKITNYFKLPQKIPVYTWKNYLKITTIIPIIPQ